MRTFREILSESEVEIDENWTKEDLINLIREEDLGQDDIAEITELVMDIAEWGEFDNLSDEEMESFDWDSWENVEEKMSNVAKKEAAKKRRKPTFKKAQRLKKKCMAKHAAKIKKTKDSNAPKVCDVDGKLRAGKSRKERRQLVKTRKKNKNKIIK